MLSHVSLNGALLHAIRLFLVGLCLPSSVQAQTGASMLQTHLVLAPTPGNPRNSEGDFIQLKDGRILFIYTKFTGGDDDHSTAHLASRVSLDQGMTWSAEDQVVVPNEGKQNVMSVSLLRLRSGDLALFYLRKNSNADCRPVVRYSRDEAKTWLEPADCLPTDLGYYVLNNSRVVQLASGRIVLPLAQHARADGKWQPGKIVLVFSDDQGGTWRRHTQELETREGGKVIDLMEPGIAEWKPDTLYMVIRTREGYVYASRSVDGGDHWTTPEATDLLAPMSPATVLRLPETGDLLLLLNDHSEKGLEHARAQPPRRTPLTAAISKDGGFTWSQKRLTLENDPEAGYCYTAAMVVGDRVLLGYCAHRSRWGLATTKISSFPWQELYK